MKKLLCLLFVFAILLSLSMPIYALDVKDSDGDYFDHEETGVTLPYRLIVPEVYDEKYVFPLVVFFHGAGERGYDNERQLDNCVQQIADNMPKALILAPQCTHDGQWVDTPWGDGCYSVDEVEESDEMMAVMALIEEIKQQYSIDEDMVYAAGISMGGFAVWDAMVRHNDVFAAGVAVCGRIPLCLYTTVLPMRQSRYQALQIWWQPLRQQAEPRCITPSMAVLATESGVRSSI